MKKRQRVRKFSEERRKRMAEALRLRKQGVGYDQIGEQLNVSNAQAYRDVQDALAEITKEPAHEVRAIELQRSEEQHMRLNAEIGRVLKHLKVTTTGAGEIDLKAVETVRRLIESQNKVAQTRHRLNGFDMGLQVDASVDVQASIDKAFATILGADPEEFED